MNDDFKYYGFYGRKSDTDFVNYRTSRQKASTDLQLNNKEFGVYVHTQNDEIPRHLEIEYSKNGEYGEHYGNVPNLTFVPIDGLLDEEIKEVQKLIDICYSFYIDESGKYASWSKIHAFAREYMHSGYDSGLSKHIVDLYADKAKEELNNNFFNKIFDEQIKPILEKQSKRTCENIHNIDTRLPKNDPTKNVEKLILEDYLYEDGEKQLLLGGREIWNYQNNPKVLNDPWLFRWAQLGFLVWNLMINKASVKCILDNNPALFPMQIILATNPNFLFFEQVDISNKNKKENIEYIGYFIVRIKYEKINGLQKDENCKKLYDYKLDKGPNNSQENYYVLFVFKKTYNIYINETGEYKPDEEKNKKLLITDKYILTDFRLQRVHWGNVTRSKRVLLIEIQQLMCSYFKEEGDKKIYFYFLSEYENGQNEPINNICKTQYEQINNIDNSKKNNNKCYEAWLDDKTREILNNLQIKLKCESYNILISKEEINSLFTKLEERNEDKLKLDEITINIWTTQDKNFNYIDIRLNNNKKYILFPCHFKWEKKDNTKKIFVLRHGDLKLANYDLRKEKDCLKGDCIINRDYISNTFNNINIFNENISIISDDYFETLDKLKNNINLNNDVINKNIKLIYKNLINKLKNKKYIDFFYNEINKYNKIKEHIDDLKIKINPELDELDETNKDKIKKIYKIIKNISNILNNEEQTKANKQLLEQSESNIIQQQGGYQINNTTQLVLYDSKYTCTFLEKQLFLLHLNCLTKVYLHENKNLDNFYIYYDDESYGFYQEILKNMFKQLTWTNTNDKNKECIFISNNLDMYHKIKPKYALMDFKPDTDNNFFDGEILYTLYPFSNIDFKILVKEYNKIKKYPYNIFQELLDNNKFFNLCYNNDLYNINKVIPIKYLKLIPGYTDNFECMLEYKILYNYFYCIHNITDHIIIMNKLFDITIDNENNIKYWINCTLNKFKNAENETDIMFKNIVKLNIEQHAKHQIHLLNDYGSEVLNKQKISKAIKILEKYASDRVYIQIL